MTDTKEDHPDINKEDRKQIGDNLESLVSEESHCNKVVITSIKFMQ